MNSLNTLGIKIPYQFLKSTISLNWCTILLALDNQFISSSDAIEYAVDLMAEREDFDNEELLAFTLLNEYENTKQLIQRITDNACRFNEEQPKLLYALLYFLYLNKEKYNDVLSMVEIIYDDFGYPDEMKSFILYMPTEHGPLPTLELNIKRLFENWRTYLDTSIYNKDDTSLS